VGYSKEVMLLSIKQRIV